MKESAGREYVPIGQDPKNKDGRICNCGSGTHVMSTHNMCPLNTTYWPNLRNSKARLNLYVTRHMWRWWKFETGDNRRCAGVLTAVTDALKLHIEYEDGGTEDVDEETFLEIVRKMKKHNSSSKKKKPKRKRKR